MCTGGHAWLVGFESGGDAVTAVGGAGKTAQKRSDKWLGASVCFPVVLAYLSTVVVSIVVASNSLASVLARFMFIGLAPVALTMALVLIVRMVIHVWGKPTSSHPEALSMTATAVLAMAVALTCFAMVRLISGDDDKRCVNSLTMTVVSSAACQSPVQPVDMNPEWYYGGTGTQIGDQVDEGSLSPPGWGGGSGGGGGSGSDDGGDSGGDDGGGGDGGGGGGE